jgi:hypothetical protein
MPKFTTKDDVRWGLQEREFSRTESGSEMLTYIEKLLSTAENHLNSPAQVSVSEAFGRALVAVEEEVGNASLHALGRIVIITCWHWQYGEALFDEFSALEKKLFSSAAMAHIQETQEAAKDSVSHNIQ